MNDLQDLSGEGRWPCLEGHSISIITLRHFAISPLIFSNGYRGVFQKPRGHAVIIALTERVSSYTVGPRVMWVIQRKAKLEPAY